MIELIGEALAIYFNVVVAFWQGLASGGGLTTTPLRTRPLVALRWTNPLPVRV